MTCARRLTGARKPAPSAGSPHKPDPRPRRRRARFSRFLPALALLLGALSLFPAAPAQAQTTVWSATLNAKSIADWGLVGTGHTGCHANNNAALAASRCFASGVLSDQDFEHGGTQYDVRQISYTSSSKTIRFRAQPNFPEELRKGTLNISGGGTTLALSLSGTNTGNLAWTVDGQSWPAGTDISVSITLPPSAVTLSVDATPACGTRVTDTSVTPESALVLRPATPARGAVPRARRHVAGVDRHRPSD